MPSVRSVEVRLAIGHGINAGTREIKENEIFFNDFVSITHIIYDICFVYAD